MQRAVRNIKEKSITRAMVMKACRRAAELDGVVPGPKTLGTFGASYLYSIRGWA